MSKRAVFLLLGGVLAVGCEQAATPSGPEPQAGQAMGSPPEAAQPAAAAVVQRRPSPEGASVYFIQPADGATVSSPFSVQFGLRGAGIAPAGIDLPNTGHHHLIVNSELPAFDAPVPTDEQHLHFGLGQTETMLTLPPGTHRLQLVFADYLHIPHDPPIVSDVITVEVVE